MIEQFKTMVLLGIYTRDAMTKVGKNYGCKQPACSSRIGFGYLYSTLNKLKTVVERNTSFVYRFRTYITHDNMTLESVEIRKNLKKLELKFKNNKYILGLKYDNLKIKINVVHVAS